MDVGKIEIHLRTILQSDESLVLDEPLEVQVAVIKNPQGAGRYKSLMYIFGEGDSLHLSKAISKTSGEDNLCLARSIAVALAKLAHEESKTSGDPAAVKNALNHLKQIYNPARQVQMSVSRCWTLRPSCPTVKAPPASWLMAFEK